MKLKLFLLFPFLFGDKESTIEYDDGMDRKPRYCGILIHPSSFNGPHGIGCLGDEARQLLGRLAAAGVNLWQILPLGPTGFGDSPYASRSTFAGNELLIDARRIPYARVSVLDSCLGDENGRIDYEKVRKFKLPILFDAADEFLLRSSSAEIEAFGSFCDENSWWLDDYALFQSLVDFHGDSRWFLWPQGEAMRNARAIEACTRNHHEQIMRYKVLQYFFFKQWDELHQFASSLGVQIIGDIPIFVAADSVDAWTNRHLFKIDKQGRQTELSGVPPDAFSSDGQLWGNPVYDWNAHEKDGFAWWKKRIEQTLKMVDIVRIDHFRGFEACWEVPAGSANAINGRWVKGPGAKLFNSLAEGLPIIAEDLGVITPEVERLRDGLGFPGMKILQFAFSMDQGCLDTANDYLPHNYDYNCVAYTGTHDNETSRGWFDHQSSEVKDVVRRYLQCPDEDVVWQMIRCIMQSHARFAVFPLQDLIGLDNNGRMNQPSTVGSSNWSWRIRAGELENWMLDRFRVFVYLYGRDNQANDRKACL